ncbi:hypothetical protein M409DRAFT_66779 [Zasmidium cellare ATCC 36951]|uniref:Major facilitator superfamily (MFS) profile domain-containing protein n=1 Tax=Zasmidium cellare ATCC 36951 TaxID=1080233 RepID=A0A6A6CKT6_ZASCE|nr:uncharacterized protein M409DRAFT_66779 [Zasmidium cellare ATCC 36951]KAF2166329.1 hypothetical protein M409DRAFT_66779 [Zasmidium cellare ATCC 36951]
MEPGAKVTGKLLNILITIASTCGFVLFGYDNALFSGLIISPWFLRTFDDPNASLLGTISATYNLGGFAGAVIAFFIGNVLGRRRTILTGIAITTIGAVPFAAATNLAQLTAGRTVCGVGVGIMSSTVGLWQAETVPARARGAYLVGQLLYGATLGLFLAQWINYGFYNVRTRVAFAFPVAFQVVFLLISTLLVLGLPESPRWLVKKGRNNEAMEVLTRLTGQDDAQERLQQIVEVDALEKNVNKSRYQALFTNGPTQNFRRLCLAVGVMIMHQLAGPNTVTYYLPRLLITFIGASRKEALWISGLSSVDSASATLVAIFTVDRFGRVPYMLWGAVAQAIMFVIIASLLGTAPPGNKSFGVAAVVMLFVYYWINSLCWLGQSWAYPAEVLPLQIREQGLAIGNMFYWLFQFMMVEITPIAVKNIYYKFYVILAAFNVCMAIIVWLLYPETAKLSLEELDLFFHEEGSVGVKIEGEAL